MWTATNSNMPMIITAAITCHRVTNQPFLACNATLSRFSSPRISAAEYEVAPWSLMANVSLRLKIDLMVENSKLLAIFLL